MARPSLSNRKKLIFAAVVVVAVPTTIELTLALVGVRPRVVAEDPYVGFQSSVPLFVGGTDDRGRAVYRTAPNKLDYFNEQSFPAVKVENAYRIFCMGGSTTHGRPYGDETSFVGWLRVFLRAADPGIDWQVINCGGVSYASYRVAALMEELIRYQPDLFIIYTGHNEFLERRTYSGIIEEHPAVTRLQLLANRSRTVSVLRSWTRSLSDDPGEAARRQHQLTGEVTAILDSSAGLDLYYRDDQLHGQIVDHYRFNLGRMAALAHSVGAEVVFIQPAANIKDFSPFKSQHRDDLGGSYLKTWQDQFDTGLEAARAGDHQTARESFEAALRVDDRYARLYYELGRSLSVLDKLDDARKAFQRAVVEDVCPLRILPDMQAALATVARQHGAHLLKFSDALGERSQHEFGHAVLGKSYFVDHVHPTIEVHRLLARMLLDYLVDLGTVHPTADWNDEIADALAAEVEGTLDKADHARAKVRLARVLRWAGKMEESDRLVREAAEVLTDDAEVFALLGAVLERQDKIDQAIELYRKALQLQPGLRGAYVNLGSLLAKHNRTEEAVALYRQVLQIDPGYVLAYQKLGVALTKLGRTDEAIQRFQQALRIDPTQSRTLVSLGSALIRHGNPDAALAALGQALQMNPRSVQAHLLRGIVLARLNRSGEAMDSYRGGLRIDPNHPELRYNLGVALLARRRPDEALEHFRHAVDARPDFADAHFNLGVILAQQGNFDQAAEHLERVLQLYPSDRLAHYNLARVYTSGGRFAEAIRVLRQGRRNAPDDPALTVRLAWILATCPDGNLRDGAEAVGLAKPACEKSGHNDVECLDTLAAAYAETGRFPEAIETVQKAIKLAASPTQAAQLARMQRRLELYQAAQPYRLPDPKTPQHPKTGA